MTDARVDRGEASSQAVFLVLRRMRIPLIVLISIFSVSVLGLTLIPGQSADGPWRMGFFDAFYFMSYTATTIGYGEIPQAFNDAQRMWVTLSIYLTVVGWAYAIGSLLTLLQDRAFRQAIAVQRFERRVNRMGEPFWLLAGHGQTGEQLGRWLDEFGRRFVVIDLVDERIDVLDLGSYTADVPGLAADAKDPGVLVLAGLRHPHCAGVLALTDDDEANLAITMSVAALRPDLPVIARSSTPAITARMGAFGRPITINPFDRFGDHFTVALRAPATEQLATWLTRTPGEPLPVRAERIPPGRWIVCGYGRFGRELTRDLMRDRLDVVVVDTIDPNRDPDTRIERAPDFVLGDGTESEILDRAGIERAVGFVAGTDNDITNVSLVASARRANPGMFVVARQNQPMNAELFAATHIDLLMVPTAVVAQEALAHTGAPLLWQFLQRLAQQDDEWSSALLDRVVERCGEASPELWQVSLVPVEAPAITRQLEHQPVLLGDLLRDPEDRSLPLPVVALMSERDGERTLTPPDDVELQAGDCLLLAGTPRGRRGMESTLQIDASAAYVLGGAVVGSSWVWRRLTRANGSA